MREVVNALLYMASAGCAWRLQRLFAQPGAGARHGRDRRMGLSPRQGEIVQRLRCLHRPKIKDRHPPVARDNLKPNVHRPAPPFQQGGS